MADKGVTLRSLPHRGISIGRGVYLGRGVVLDIPRGAKLDIGDGALITHYSVIAASKQIRIGPRTQIAEHCSIRDSDHGLRSDQDIRSQALIATPIDIGEDVWIGRGCAILRGATIGDRSVVGANSLVKAAIPSGCVAVGSPARVIRNR
jgi:acetyltransferase-like isoleucine patch superfamily enzyme